MGPIEHLGRQDLSGLRGCWSPGVTPVRPLSYARGGLSPPGDEKNIGRIFEHHLLAPPSPVGCK